MAKKTISTVAASLQSSPLKQVQRQTVRDLMPEIYLMRHKDYSFAQIATLMVDCGFNLRPSTLRRYFHEFLAEREAECLKRMDEQILLLTEAKKGTQGVEMSQISVKAATIKVQQTQEIRSLMLQIAK